MGIAVANIKISEVQFTEQIVLRFYRVSIKSIVGTQLVGAPKAEFSYSSIGEVIPHSLWSDAMKQYATHHKNQLDRKHFRWSVQLSVVSYVFLSIILLVIALGIVRTKY